jgi:hypothetical protein
VTRHIVPAPNRHLFIHTQLTIQYELNDTRIVITNCTYQPQTATFRRFSPAHSLRQHTLLHAVVVTELSAALSGTSRAICHAKMSIQRITPSIPPAISAGILQNVQFVHSAKNRSLVANF